MIHPSRLGATLYVPADRNDLLQIAAGAKYPGLRSVIFCVEDAVAEGSVPAALENLERLFANLACTNQANSDRPAVFVRPRHPSMLARITAMPGAEYIEGFVLPKVTAQSIPAYMSAIVAEHHSIMPTIETREAFDQVSMRALRSELIKIRERVVVIRIGGNDLLQTLGARRSKNRTIYEGPLAGVISSLISTFMPHGFAMSSPVFDSFCNLELLREEIEMDLDHGLFTKAAIHPLQIEAIHMSYKVSVEDLLAARAILDLSAPAVFSRGGFLMEPATHTRWAENTIIRAESFGTQNAPAKMLSAR